jgi:predicted RNase H-like nuclease
MFKSLAGVDLAWQSERNPTAIAFGQLSDRGLLVTAIDPALYGVDAVAEQLARAENLCGVAIDAPLIINNVEGQRPCEKLLSQAYGSRHASCHTSNLARYPDAASVVLSRHLSGEGFQHLGGTRWQIECYPHPAIIELFNLHVRLKYKKGRVHEKRAGQRALAGYLERLAFSPVLRLAFADGNQVFLEAAYIDALRGQALKTNEDALDSVVCLYIAALFELGVSGQTFGNEDTGYIWVPTISCL